MSLLSVPFKKEFETILLKNDIKEAMKTMVPGSIEALFLCFNEEYKKCAIKKKISSELNTILNDILNKTNEKALYKECNLRTILIEYDFPSTSEKRKKEIIDTLFKDYCQYNLDYPKPDIYTKIAFDSKIPTFPTQLTQEMIKTETQKKLDEKHDKLAEFKYIKQMKKHEVIEQMKDIPKEYIEILQFNCQFEFLSKKATIALAKCIQSSKMNVTYRLNYSSFTIKQLELFDEFTTDDCINKNYLIQEIINKKYAPHLSQYEGDDYKQREILLEIYSFTKNYPKFKEYQASILQMILEKGIATNNYDLKVFQEFIQHPLHEVYSSIFNQKYQVKQRTYNVGSMYSSEQKSNELIPKYLQYFFMNSIAKVKDFENYFQLIYLQTVEAKAKILKGELISRDGCVLSKEEYDSLCKKVEITICQHNKSCFAIDETVVIELDIKNVPVLFAKIFEINTENYYLANKKPITSLINIEGLLTKLEDTYNFNESPQKLIRYKISLDKIPKRRGVYIIELNGNGISSRIIIKKGNLTVVSRSTGKGKLCYILDEKQDICKKNAGLWFKGTKYNCDKETGAIVLPYQFQSLNDSLVVLFNGSYGELANLEIPIEHYELKGHFILNHETITSGGISKIIFKPLLLINNKETLLSYMKKCKVTASIYKNENMQIIPIVTTIDTFPNVKDIDDTKQYEFEVTIPSRIQSMNLEFECEVFNTSKRKYEKLTITQGVNIKYSFDSMYETFLRKTQENKYILSLLGKNGEVIPNKMIQIIFQLRYYELNYEVKLQTNNKGEIDLGPLSDFISIKALIDYREIGTYYIQDSEHFSYPGLIDIIQGQNIILPYQGIESNIKLVKINNISDNKVLQVIQLGKGNYSLDSLKTPCANDYQLTLSKLAIGAYILYLNNNQIRIEVHDGRFWLEANNFIITNTKLIENSSSQTPIYIKELQFDDKEIKFKANSLSKNYSANVYLFQYLPQNIHYYSKLVTESINSANTTNDQNLQQWKNIYLSNRTINEEIQYVLDRKNYEQIMGNSLEMPSLLLKRQFTKDSSLDKETINKGTKYEKKDAEEISKVHQKYFDAKDSQEPKGEFSATEFQNFINQIPYIQLGITPNPQTGEMIINLPSSITNWCHCHIICFDDKSVCSELFPIANAQEVQKRKITLHKALNNDKNYIEARKTELLLKDQKIVISELANYKIIDSITQVVDYILVKNPQFKKDWGEIEFLIENEINEEQFVKKLSQYISHEVNIFLYFKYPHLFDKYIKPILKYKFEKTFIDYFLLDDITTIKKYLTVENVSKLNLFELCLLIMKIAKDYPEDAKKIRNIIQMRVKTHNIQALITSNFDIMINMELGSKSDLERDNFVEEELMEVGLRYDRCQDEDAVCFECDGGEIQQSQHQIGLQSNLRNQFDMVQPQQQRMMMQSNQMQACSQQASCFGGGYSNSNSNNASSFQNIMQPQMFMAQSQFLCQPDVMNERKIQAPSQLREVIQAQYDKPSGPKEYKERHYLNKNHKINLTSPLWLEYADYLLMNHSNVNFLSKYLLANEQSFSEMIWIISILDLPITRIKHSYKRVEERSIEITAGSNMMLFTKKITEANTNINNNILISQNISEKGKEDIEIVSFKKSIVYNHETIVTNISNKTVILDLFIQIPEGAIPMDNSDYSETKHITLNSYVTTSVIVNFYFPEEGVFNQYHPVATIDNDIISIGSSLEYKVLSFKTYKSISDSEPKLEEIIANGETKDILAFLKTHPIKRNELKLILWLLKDKAFFTALIAIFRQWGMFYAEVWSFGFYHYDELVIKEYLNSHSTFATPLGDEFNSSLLKVNNTNNYAITDHREYSPFINARVHLLGKNSNGLLNAEFKEKYESFIISLLKLNSLNIKHLLRLTYYLILQDRIEEAGQVFERIKIDKQDNNYESQVIQYDYLNSYLDFSLGYPKFTIARENCKKYHNFPMAFWSELFEEIEDQLIEYDGKEKISSFANEAEYVEKEINKRKNKKEAKAELPKLSFNIEQKKLQIYHSNISEVTIKFYLIDLEILFSRNPFISTNTDDFSFVQPNYITKLKVENQKKGIDLVTSFDIPKEFISKNLFIEVSSESKKEFKTYFSADIQVFISENLGEIKVCDSKNVPLRKTYVKCFYRTNKEVKFYKDGYTDLRGLFNYLELNTDQLNNIEDFSIFVCHDENGSIIKQCKPPYNIQRVLKGNQNENQKMDKIEMIQSYKQQQRKEWRMLNK